MLNNFEKFSFPSIEKRWTKDKEKDRKKEKKKKKKKKMKKYRSTYIVTSRPPKRQLTAKPCSCQNSFSDISIIHGSD